MIFLPFDFTRRVHVRFRPEIKSITATSSKKLKNQFRKNKISMGKNLLTKTSMGKPSNEMGNCPFASPLVALLHAKQILQLSRFPR
jgi:hypothetical protein